MYISSLESTNKVNKGTTKQLDHKFDKTWFIKFIIELVSIFITDCYDCASITLIATILAELSNNFKLNLHIAQGSGGGRHKNWTPTCDILREARISSTIAEQIPTHTNIGIEPLKQFKPETILLIGWQTAIIRQMAIEKFDKQQF